MNSTLLTDEDIKQAWQDCYGEPLPVAHGLVFGRTMRSRQDAHTKSILADEVRKIENPYENQIKTAVSVVRSTGFEHCRNAVLKLIEDE